MNFIPRPYQAEAIKSALDYFHGPANHNSFQVLPTGSGKSVVIANIGKELNDKTIVFQPSKEILEQNYRKFTSYGFNAGIYSASAGHKVLGNKITFATIGSVAKKHHLFQGCKNIIVDECHLVNAKGGMYHDFIHSIPGAKVLGLTATPYRLTSGMDGAMLKFINRTNPRIFKRLIYYIQNDVLFNSGHLCKLEYYPINVIDRNKLQVNTTGTDFTDQSMKRYYSEIDMPAITAKYANRLLAKRKNLLVFCSLIEEAKKVAQQVPGAEVLTGETESRKREDILSRFKSGSLKCVVNVGVLTIGFDYPELETILIARSTMSLALYYQIIGRAMRPHLNKESAWIVDLGGNCTFFGKIETMQIRQNEKGLYAVWNGGRQLTNVLFTKN